MGNQPESMIDPNGLRTELFTHSSGVAADNMSPEEHAAWDRIDQLSRKGFEDQEGIFAIIDLSLGGPASGVMNPADVNIYYGAEAANFLQGYAFRKALGTLFGNGNGQGAQNIIDPRGERVNGILVRDFPEDGYFIEGEYAYDLSAFDQFYTDYGEKFVTDRIKRKDGNVIKLNEYDDVRFNGEVTTFYAEASSLLSIMPDPALKKQKVTVLPNMDVSKVGHSDYINSVYPYLDGFRSIRVNGKATIHTHFRPGMITYKSGPFSNDAIILNIGPSDADYNGASNHIRHVMVDNRYIYLYTQDPKNTIIYKRK